MGVAKQTELPNFHGRNISPSLNQIVFLVTPIFLLPDLDPLIIL
jgi:hypothetical protein